MTRPSLRPLPAAPGVYRFRDDAGRVLYIGRAVDLRRRVASYWRDQRDRRHLSAMVARVTRVEAVVCDSEHEAAWLERNLLEAGLPRWNRTPGGAEVPLYLRLGPAELGTARVTEPAPGQRHFGPYLGGLRVRLARAALHRVYPLAYTAERLTGAERDLARLRGIAPPARAGLWAALTRVLEGDPAARAVLRAELGRRRDAAAAAQAYELAGTIQAELAAVDWVLAEQKVSLATPESFDVYGWAGGVLVHFGMRDGRLSIWRQRSASESAARARLAATPPAWRDFARRGAELGAKLSTVE